MYIFQYLKEAQSNAEKIWVQKFGCFYVYYSRKNLLLLKALSLFYSNSSSNFVMG